ncbi:MAG: non-canonical purine NTP pyrophosphatase, partial [Bacteroidota bacterium]
MEIIIASHNQHKVEEIRSIIGADRLILRSLNDVGYHDEIVEDGATLEANAWIKANAIHGLYGGNVMSDDTGLEVDALDGAPGVISARFAGPQRDHEDNMDKLLSMLSQHDNRKAQFRTIV